MQITPQTLKALQNGFNAAFLKGFNSAEAQWPLIAMEVSSQSALENYGWMKELPGMREWIGQRVIHNLEMIGYQIINKHWEHTVGVDRNDIEDDKLGLYSTRFSMQGEVAKRHPDELMWQVLLSGFNSLAMDGQYFFDTDHLGFDAAGNETSWSNYQAGASSPWFLMDLSRSFMKPLVFQNRSAVKFVNQSNETDDNVFMNRQFRFGVDGRYNGGFGFYQLAYASKAALDATNYQAARLALGTQRRPDGTVLPIHPTHLIVGPTNEAAALALLNKELVSGGETNIWYKTAQLVVVPQLG
ncbi:MULTISPECIES: Mu-like prophage major head subunit gpT family protein [Methylococcus]|uniref:Mu-like prophage major head subunit gpT family protein n=1 Tax=Methylococcus capsulatus TaxID=414 RepID=A0ABZ2F399_METCP|nr:Mu-like prophage major head subunit gpT family protein [Methylococcus sp. BF19-07]